MQPRKETTYERECPNSLSIYSLSALSVNASASVICRMGEQINTLIRTGCKAEGRLQRERERGLTRLWLDPWFMDIWLTQLHVVCWKSWATHMREVRTSKAAVFRRATYTCWYKRSTRVLLPKCRALEKDGLGKLASEKSSRAWSPFNLKTADFINDTAWEEECDLLLRNYLKNSVRARARVCVYECV